jgi:hypothetical protein
MTISKKLLLITTIGLGIQCGTFAKFDALHVKNEITTILNFIPTLREQTDVNAKKIIQWLETQLDNTDWQTALDNFHIIALANTITQNTTIDAKINDIQTIIANKNAETARLEQKEYKRLKEGILVISGMAALYLAFIYNLKNTIYLFNSSYCS